MKLLTLGVRIDGKNRDELQQQLTELLPEIRFVIPPDLSESASVPPDVLLISMPSEAGQVPEILGKFIGAGFELISVAYQPVAGNGLRKSAVKKGALPPAHFVDSYQAASRTMGNLQRDLLENLLKTTAAAPRKINLPTLNGFRRFELNTIIRCESTDNYTNVYFTDRKKILVSRSLQEFESRLAPSGFFRVHHKHLINTEHIVEYQRGKGGQVIMSDNSSIDVSVRRKTDFMRYINDFC